MASMEGLRRHLTDGGTGHAALPPVTLNMMVEALRMNEGGGSEDADTYAYLGRIHHALHATSEARAESRDF